MFITIKDETLNKCNVIMTGLCSYYLNMYLRIRVIAFEEPTVVDFQNNFSLSKRYYKSCNIFGYEDLVHQVVIKIAHFTKGI